MTDTANTLVGTNAITGTTLLNSVFLENTGATLFSTNDVISFGAKKGGAFTGSANADGRCGNDSHRISHVHGRLDGDSDRWFSAGDSRLVDGHRAD
jgi:hypothetical protein